MLPYNLLWILFVVSQTDFIFYENFRLLARTLVKEQWDSRACVHADCITPGATGNVEPFLLGLLFLASAAAAVTGSCSCSRLSLVASSSSRRLVVVRIARESHDILVRDIYYNINLAPFFPIWLANYILDCRKDFTRSCWCKILVI